jgi:ketosteroid isomerase-like protein
MNFRETLGRHLLAIEERNLEALAATVADPLLLIMADGKLKRTKSEFVEAHRGWFAMKNWTLSAKPVEIYENAGLGVAVLHLDYREDGKASESYLTLVFENRGGEWLMVQDQNTPIR